MSAYREHELLKRESERLRLEVERLTRENDSLRGERRGKIIAAIRSRAEWLAATAAIIAIMLVAYAVWSSTSNRRCRRVAQQEAIEYAVSVRGMSRGSVRAHCAHAWASQYLCAVASGAESVALDCYVHATWDVGGCVPRQR